MGAMREKPIGLEIKNEHHWAMSRSEEMHRTGVSVVFESAEAGDLLPWIWANELQLGWKRFRSAHHNTSDYDYQRRRISWLPCAVVLIDMEESVDWNR
jgi:hypothetical protein